MHLEVILSPESFHKATYLWKREKFTDKKGLPIGIL